MTMQNVAWPITIVISPGSKWWTGLLPKNELSAMPVTTPGSAMGRTSRNVIASRPKNRNRATAVAAAVPSRSATDVARTAAFSERTSASRASWSCQAELNHFVLKPAIGQLWMFEELNAYTQISTSGSHRKSTTATVHTLREIRVARVSIGSERLECSEPLSYDQIQAHDNERDRRVG